MSIQLKEATVREGYLDARIEGSYEGIKQLIPQYAEYQAKILAACKKHGCHRILLDCHGVDYKPNAILEHFLGVSLADLHEPRLRLAVLASKTTEPRDTLLELVANNRGVHLRVFWDRDEAVSWLLSD